MMDPELPLRNAGKIANTRIEMRVLYVLMTLVVVVGFALFENQADHLERSDRAQDRLGVEVVDANRKGCEQTNVLRFNQAQLIQGEIDRTEVTLKAGLRGLEDFRKEIEEGQAGRRRAIRRLRQSVNGSGVKGKPYAVDCVEAYP